MHARMGKIELRLRTRQMLLRHQQNRSFVFTGQIEDLDEKQGKITTHSALSLSRFKTKKTPLETEVAK